MSNQQSACTQRESFGQKMANLYTWNKICVLSMNAIYLLSIFQDFYDAGNHIIEGKYSTEGYRAIPAGAVVTIITSSIMMFCLLFDMVVMSTNKLSLAYHYWRPGLFFFAVNCSGKGINMMRMLLNSSEYIRDCEYKIISVELSPHSLVSTMCHIDVRLTNLTAAMALVRDVSICVCLFFLFLFTHTYVLLTILFLTHRKKYFLPKLHTYIYIYSYRDFMLYFLTCILPSLLPV
ncbi:hypothetical protein F4703DRAFT_1110981 [Phycomyces blakesleeanus]